MKLQRPTKICFPGIKTNRFRSNFLFTFLIIGSIALTNHNGFGQKKEVSDDNLFPVFMEESIFKSSAKTQGWGFIDRSGARIIPGNFSAAGQFSEGLAPVREGVFPRRSDNDDSDNRKPVMHKWGYINREGTVIIGYQFEAANKFSEGLARITLNGKVGFIDRSGRIVIDPEYEDAGNFSNGLAWIRMNNKYGFIDHLNKIIIDPTFDKVNSFSEEIAAVKISKNYVFISKNGSKLIPTIFDDAGSFSDGLARVRIGRKWGFIKKTGEFVVQPTFEECGFFSEGLAAVKINGLWGFIDTAGKTIIKQKYQGASQFSEGLAGVKIGDGWGYIDRKGKVVISAKYTSVRSFFHGFGEVTETDDGNTSEHSKNWAILDKEGSVVFHQKRHVDGIGYGELMFYFNAYISLRSEPTGAAVYLIPLYTWENNPDIVNDDSQLENFRVSQGNTDVETWQPEKVFKGIFALKGQKRVIDVDVTQHGNTSFKVIFQ